MVLFLKSFPVCLEVLQEVLLLGYCLQKHTIILLSVQEALNQLARVSHVRIAADLMVGSLNDFVFLDEFLHFRLEELFEEEVGSEYVETLLFLL